MAVDGTIVPISGNGGRIAQARVHVRGGLRVFSVYFWHSEGWTLRSEALLEAVLKQAKTTRHPWLTAFDANMCPEDVEESVVSKGSDACSSSKRSVDMQIERPKGGWVERTHDYVMACNSLKGKSHRCVKAAQSRVFCGREREKEIQE